MKQENVVTGDQGWKYLFNAPKQHYFKQGQSLCGRWMTFGHGDCTEDDGKPQQDECVSCRRKLTPALAPKPKPRAKKIMPHEVYAELGKIFIEGFGS